MTLGACVLWGWFEESKLAVDGHATTRGSQSSSGCAGDGVRTLSASPVPGGAALLLCEHRSWESRGRRGGLLSAQPREGRGHGEAALAPLPAEAERPAVRRCRGEGGVRRQWPPSAF